MVAPLLVRLPTRIDTAIVDILAGIATVPIVKLRVVPPFVLLPSIVTLSAPIRLIVIKTELLPIIDAVTPPAGLINKEE